MCFKIFKYHKMSKETYLCRHVFFFFLAEDVNTYFVKRMEGETNVGGWTGIQNLILGFSTGRRLVGGDKRKQCMKHTFGTKPNCLRSVIFYVHLGFEAQTVTYPSFPCCSPSPPFSTPLPLLPPPPGSSFTLPTLQNTCPPPLSPPTLEMATLARVSKKALNSILLSQSHRLLHRGFATEASKAITPSPDRVKWDYRGQRKIIPQGQWVPKIAVDAYVAPNVVLAGQVAVLDGSSVWSGSVLRGDLNKIIVGFCSNVQERCVIHAAWSSPTGEASEFYA